MYSKLKFFLKIFGFDISRFIRTIISIPYFIRTYISLKKQAKDGDFKFGKWYPILYDRFEEGGQMSGHYFHQDLYVAQRIFINTPQRHVDIGSRTDGFVAHLAVFREVELIDIRPIKESVRNVIFRQGDLMKLPSDLIDYCDSISSLHALEHFGLGRYGDPIDYDGFRKAFNNIYKILKKGGRFYFSVPVGPQRIEFNAQRVFDLSYLINIIEPFYQIERLSIVDDSGHFHENVNLDDHGLKNNFNNNFGCGIFELRKL